jgi:hypothetical protein
MRDLEDRSSVDFEGDTGLRTANTNERRRIVQRKTLIALESFVSLSGVGGGIYMATHPLTVMSMQYLHDTWFHTWRWPGLALLFFVGLCPAVVIVASARSLRVAPIGHLCVGIGLIAWVTLEAAWIVTSAGLQIAFGVIGAAIAYLGFRNLLDSRHVPRDGAVTGIE